MKPTERIEKRTIQNFKLAGILLAVFIVIAASVNLYKFIIKLI